MKKYVCFLYYTVKSSFIIYQVVINFLPKRFLRLTIHKGQCSNEVVMLLFDVCISLLFCSSAQLPPQPLAQVAQAISFDNYKSEFFKALYGTVDTCVVGILLHDFKQQIANGCADPVRLHQLLQQLPFEPDNLRTGDCTFHACCTVLMLKEYLDTQNPNLLEILGHIAVLTYFRHSVVFFADIFKTTLERCNTVIGGRLDKPLAEYYKEFANMESAIFLAYKTNVLEKMTAYITSQKIPITTAAGSSQFLKIAVASDLDEKFAGKLEVTKTGTVKIVSASDDDDGSLRVVYKKAAPRKKGPGEELEDFSGDGGVKLLMSHVYQKLGQIVKVTRQFNGTLGIGGSEIGRTCLHAPRPAHPDVDVTYLLSSTSVQVTSPAIPATQQRPEIYSPTLVLQMPTTAVITDTIEEYFTESEKVFHAVQVHPDLIVQEKATRHAMVASFAIAATQNTWFSGRRGLAPSQSLVRELDLWKSITLRNFEMYVNLSHKN